MKKIIIAALAFVTLLVSCAKDPIGNTAAVAMAGEWYVTVDIVDGNGELLYGEDPYGMGSFLIATFNTAADNAEDMYISDNLNFWQFQVPVKADPATLTFASDGAVANLVYEDCDVTITDGKITYGTGVTPSGQPADEISFLVTFGDDPNGFIHRIHGYRYTGLVADE